MAFDGKLLFGAQSLPGEVARFREGAHLTGSRGKLANRRPEASVEKFGERTILERLELAHIDMVLADERLDLARATLRVLIGGVEPVIERLRFDPLSD